MKERIHKHGKKYDGPLVKLTPTQLEEAFDSMSIDGNRKILAAARAGKTSTLYVAAVHLVVEGDESLHRIVFTEMEYGDHEGRRMVDNFADEVIRTQLLHPGEKLVKALWSVHLIDKNIARESWNKKVPLT